ncbi:MAG: nucleotide exchange factor GrpE [Gemmatimonadota bacterium]
MTDKPIFDDTDITQADGEKEVPEELDGAEVLPVEPAESKAERLEDENAQLREQQLRLAAEFDNFRKRVARERAETADRAQAAFVVKMLSVLDDLDRLVAEESGAQEPHYEATVLINKKLRKELEAAGLEAINPTGQPFDPKVHEAVSTLPLPDPSKDHVVAATFQTGYTFKGTLIRPAMVQVYSDQGQV